MSSHWFRADFVVTFAGRNCFLSVPPAKYGAHKRKPPALRGPIGPPIAIPYQEGAPFQLFRRFKKINAFQNCVCWKPLAFHHRRTSSRTLSEVRTYRQNHHGTRSTSTHPLWVLFRDLQGGKWVAQCDEILEGNQFR